MKDFTGLTAAQKETLGKAQEELNRIPLIPCTTCNYCAKVCPMEIGISGSFTAMNYLTLYGDKASALHQENWLVGGHGLAVRIVFLQSVDPVIALIAKLSRHNFDSSHPITPALSAFPSMPPLAA